MKQIVTLILMIYVHGLFAQKDKTNTIIFQPAFGNAPLLDSIYYFFNKNDSAQITELKFYVSEIKLLNKNKVVWKEKNSFHLVDAANEPTLRIALQTPSKIVFDQIKFNLGIDSITSVSGAMGGDLDPTKGMYWAWLTGYVNFKLEGRSNKCTTRNNEFQFHLGGYQYYNALRSITLNIKESEQIIYVDIKKFIESTDLENEPQMMVPGKEAMLLSDKAAQIFSVQE